MIVREANFSTRPARMLRVVLAWFWLVLGILSTQAADQDLPHGPEGGQRLARELCDLRPVEDTNWQGVLKISGRNHKTISIPISYQWRTGEATWSVTYLTSSTNSIPAESLTIIFSTNAAPQYFYARASSMNAAPGEPQLVTGTNIDIPLAGSDFWLSDLGFEFYHWPVQNYVKWELRRSQGCYVLESTNPKPSSGGYSRVKMWIDTEHLAPLEGEAYGADGRLLKEFELGSIEKVNGQYELRDLKISNRKTGSRTQLLFDLQTK